MSKATNPIDDHKNKHEVYVNGKRITVLVNPVEEILYTLRPKLDHETGKNRVNKVAQARLDLYAAITRALPKVSSPMGAGLKYNNIEKDEAWNDCLAETIAAIQALFDIGGTSNE